MRSAKRGGRALAALLALAFGLLAPVLIGVQNAGTAQASGPGHEANTPRNRTVPCTAAGITADPYPYAKDITATIDGITPTVVSATSGDVLTVTGVMTNSTPGPIYDLRYVFQRGEALSSVVAIKAEIASPSRPDAVVGQNWKILGPTAGPPAAPVPPATAAPTSAATEISMSPGTSVRFVATVPINSAQGLLIATRGVYPLMIKVSGDVGTNGCVQYERVGEFHLLATVLSVPKAAQTTLTGPNSTFGSDVTGNSVSSTDIPTQGLPTTAVVSAQPPGTTTPLTGEPPATTASGVAPRTSPPTTASAPPGPGAAGKPDGQASTPVNLIWPIVDVPHMGVSGIFLDDDLATAISPGGRLDRILGALRQVGTETATTIVVDPELLAEIQQMADGYRVTSNQEEPQSALTATTPSPTITPTPSPDRTTTPARAASGLPRASTTAARPATRTQPKTGATPPPAATAPATTAPPSNRTPAATGPRQPPSTPGPNGPTSPARTLPPTTSSITTTPAILAPPDVTVAGRGQAAATVFLTALRAAVADRQVLVLPYSDPDTVAMVRAGLGSQLSSLVSRGRQVAAKVLGIGAITAPGQPGLITTMSMPDGGFVDDATLALLSDNGMTQTLLSPSTLQHPGGAAGAVTIDETGNNGHPVNAVVTDADVLAMVNAVIAKGRSAGLALRLNALAAVLAGGNFDGSATPLILTQPVRWTPDVAGLQVLTGLFQTMGSGGILTAGSLPAIADSAKLRAQVSYPDTAEQKELDPGYLAAVGRDLAWLAGVKASLAKTKGDLTLDPHDLLDPLSSAMETTMSAGLRVDLRAGRDILRTTEATLGPLRDQLRIAAGTSYTLAASTSPLLINVRNDLPYVVTARVVILNPQTVGMTATDPGPLSIPAGQSRQFKITTKVVKAGRFPVQVQLLAADGSAWSDPQTITVRSSAYGTLTVVLIIVAGGALSLMVAIRIVQRIRSRGDGDEADPTDLVTAGNRTRPGASTDAATNPPNSAAETDSSDDADTADDPGGESTR